MATFFYRESALIPKNGLLPIVKMPKTEECCRKNREKKSPERQCRENIFQSQRLGRLLAGGVNLRKGMLTQTHKPLAIISFAPSGLKYPETLLPGARAPG
jgi:hypothetical protein